MHARMGHGGIGSSAQGELNGHPERKSRDPDEVTVKLTRRDPSTALGMTNVGAAETTTGAHGSCYIRWRLGRLFAITPFELYRTRSQKA
jgi:hypothetical protein